MRILSVGLLIIHGILLLWSVGGFLEMILPSVPWKPFTNPDFPDWLLLFHWGSVLIASVGFLHGYRTRWNRTPAFMAGAYGLMGLVCVVETFGYMTSSMKYLAMSAELLTYAAILTLLFRSEYFSNHFRRESRNTLST